MIETFLLRDMALVMTIAAVMTLLCQRFKQPVVIGYLLAGLIIGPYTPPFALIRDLHSIHTMAELGLVFLMFALGLEFSLPKLRKVGFSAILGATLEVFGMLAIGYFLGRLFGWTQGDSIFLGAILSMSSTTIIVKVFMDLKLLQADFVKVVFGILILEDIVAILILSVLSGLGTSGADTTTLLINSMLKIIFFIVLFLVFGLLLVPRFLRWVASFKVKEVLGITVLGLCLASSFLASQFGLSVALGAFLIGAVIAASNEIEQVEEWIPSVRDMFSAIFFVSAGMMIQPQILWEYKWHIIIISLATVVGKVVTDSVGCFLSGINLKTSFKVGVSLGQIGEFSFVIASLGAALKVTSDFFFPLAVGVSSITTLCTPYLIKNSDRIVDVLLRVTPKSFQTALDRYQARRLRKEGVGGQNQRTLVLSKYWIRLVVYSILIAGILSLIHLASGFILSTEGFRFYLFLIWVIAAFISLPFFILIGKYGNHILFLFITKFPRMLRIINVNLFYKSTLVLLFGIMGCAYLLMAKRFVQDLAQSWEVIGIIILVGILIRRQLSAVAEWMERLLDEVLGLATSEPNRQAAMIEEKISFLDGVMEPISLSASLSSLGKTIRDLRLREQTGASVVAIYREGKHISNPSPNTQLILNDILIVIGDEEDRRKVKAILLDENLG